MTHERDLPNGYDKELYPGQWIGEDEQPAKQLVRGLNIFKMLQAFAQEQVLDTDDKKAVMGFQRDTTLESIMLDGDLNIDDLTDKQKAKLNEYFDLFTKVKLDSSMDKNTAEKVMNRLSKNEELRRKVKKKRWKEVKREIKN